MKTNQIGANAGIVWRTLSAKHDKMTFGSLLIVTGLNPIDLATALGWLAREDKVHFTEEGGKEYVSVYQECYY